MKIPSSPLYATLSALLLAFVLQSCKSTVPVTGRQQFNMLPPSEEAALGLTEFQKMKDSKKVSTNSEYNALVQRVGSRLSKVMPVPNAEWEFVVFEDATPNAFALPGGKVGINTGLFPISQNEAGLAAVVGHEVAHVVARHSGERATQSAATNAVVAGAGLLLNKQGMGAAIPSSVLEGGALLATRSWSRAQELEADRIGAVFMAKAGYDPREAVALWKRFAAWKQQNQQTSPTPSFLSTHPMDEKRISELERYMPEALAEYKQ